MWLSMMLICMMHISMMNVSMLRLCMIHISLILNPGSCIYDGYDPYDGIINGHCSFVAEGVIIKAASSVKCCQRTPL